MSAKETSEAQMWDAKRKDDLEKFEKAAATTAEYLLRRQRKEVLEKCHRIALVGAGTDPNCASRIRTEKLLGYGLEIVPVIPRLKKYLGFPCYSSLAEIPGEVDIVQVYPCEGVDLPKVARETVEKKAKAFWVEEDECSLEVREILSQGGVQVVEHESLEREYSKHFPFLGPGHVPTSSGKRVTVEGRMTRHPVTVQRHDGIKDALEKMKQGRFRHLPLVDDQGGKLIGMLSDRDIRLIRPSLAFVSHEEAATQLWSTSVEQTAVFDPVTIPPDASLEQAAELMLRWGIGGLPVISKERVLMGIITYTDLLREFVARGN